MKRKIYISNMINDNFYTIRFKSSKHDVPQMTVDPDPDWKCKFRGSENLLLLHFYNSFLNHHAVGVLVIGLLQQTHLWCYYQDHFLQCSSIWTRNRLLEYVNFIRNLFSCNWYIIGALLVYYWNVFETVSGTFPITIHRTLLASTPHPST